MPLVSPLTPVPQLHNALLWFANAEVAAMAPRLSLRNFTNPANLDIHTDGMDRLFALYNIL